MTPAGGAGGPRCLAIAPEPFFTPRGTPMSVYYRTLVTAELGVRVDLLTYGEGRDVDIPGVRLVRIPRFGFLGPVKVGPSYLKAFLDIFLALWTVALLLRRRYDYVHAHEEAVFLCRLLQPIFRFRLVYDMHSILSQQLTNFRFTRSRLLIGLFRRLEEGVLANAEAVITISPELAAQALERMPDPERHFLIENSLFEPIRMRGDTGRAEPELPDGIPDDRPVVLYAGTFESYQGLDLLIPAFARSRDRCPDAFLLMVGGRPEQVEACRQLAAGHGLDGHVLFTGAVDPDVARALTRDADVLTSPRSTGSNTPLKIYEQLASGVPLVATRIRAHTQVLDDDVCVLVEPDPESLAAGLVRALEGGPEISRRITAARDLYRQRYSRQAYVEKMRRLLQRIEREGAR